MILFTLSPVRSIHDRHLLACCWLRPLTAQSLPLQAGGGGGGDAAGLGPFAGGEAGVAAQLQKSGTLAAAATVATAGQSEDT